MEILDGKSVAQKYIDEIKIEVEELKKEYGITPGLAVILVGNDIASQIYVNKKIEACKKVGFYSVVHEMPEDIKEDKIIDTIQMMNNNPNLDGILVQLPLPRTISTSKIIETISPKKDVDGFHPYNVGRLVSGLDGFVAATPLGVMKLLQEYNIKCEGKNVVVIGASNIVGKPMASLFLNANATVTICHIYTKNLLEHTKNADILVVGVGKINLITKDMVKDGAIVIDIGINRNEHNKIVGDVDYEGVCEKASYITPVPGGVGPMTIAMLLNNTIKAAKERI